jgi:uncharacterized protein
MRSLAICLTMLTAVLAAAAEEPKKPDRIRVLLVTGVDPFGHNWRETAPAIRKVLEEDKRFDVRIVEDPEFLASSAINGYDVIFLHFSKDDHPSSQATRDNLTQFVKNGRGLVVLHAACTAFADWPEFANLAGRVFNGDLVHPHDPRGPFTVKIVQPQHPITREMGDFEADDELFTCLAGDRPVKVLATARSKVTGKDHPMAFVFDCGKGRVFHTALGHDVRSIELPGVAELIRRGCVWAAGQQP